MRKKKSKNLTLRFGKKQFLFTKQKVELLVLFILVAFVAAAQFSGFYPYVYSYAICKDKPLEVIGDYYRIPSDENYGIHPGSDYSRCYDYPLPEELQRDPSSLAVIEKKRLQGPEGVRIANISDYTVYKPEGYDILSFKQSDNGDRFETNFKIKTASGMEFDVSEMKKGASYDYVQNCHKKSTENWSGTIIGLDSEGRKICKTNLSKFVTKYTVGIYIDQTAIIMRTDSTAEAPLKDEVIKIFSSMKPVDN